MTTDLRTRGTDEAIRDDRVPAGPASWKDRIIRSRYFVAALLLHLLIFLLVAAVVVWEAPTPPNTVFHGIDIRVPPAPPPPQPSAGDAALNPQLEAQSVTVPVVAPPSVITTMESSFKVDQPKITDPSLSRISEKIPVGSGLSAGSGESGAGAGRGLFGSFTGGDNELQGAVYDLKISPTHQPTGMDEGTYTNLLRSFVAKGWDESVLAPYYKATKKLFTSAIWIPTTASQDCADKMRLDRELSPNFWVGWYHAKVTPMQAGKYHFVGFGDDILVVAINGQTVFDGSMLPVTPAAQNIPWSYQDWSASNPYRDANYAKLRAGTSFEVNGVEPVTVDVLMGDEPGGFYSAFLLIADESKTYPVDSHGVPLYPIFQIGTDAIHRSGDQPPHATDPAPWAAP
jgi:hypothetical protein